MIVESIALAAAIASFDPYVQPGHQPPNSGVRQVATPRPYTPAVADSVHRPGFSGRLWHGTVHMGGVPSHVAGEQPSPGPVAYGAHPHTNAQVYVRVGHVIVAISPWEELPQHGMKRFEAARQEWLSEHGYTNAVRTFMNDANFAAQHEWTAEHARADAPADAATDVPASEIKPRAIIELAPDAPRMRSRIRVDAAPRVIRVLPEDRPLRSASR